MLPRDLRSGIQLNMVVINHQDILRAEENS